MSVFACLFVILAGCDLLLTHALCALGAVELNPLARAILHRDGWSGLALGQAVLCGLVIGLTARIERRRPRWGRWLLAAFVLLRACVVLWSAGLLAYLL